MCFDLADLEISVADHPTPVAYTRFVTVISAARICAPHGPGELVRSGCYRGPLAAAPGTRIEFMRATMTFR